MLDLGFVRANRKLVEEKLRLRGADPAALLGDFPSLDQARRETITTAEQLKANRNQLSQTFGSLKKSGGDTTAVQMELQANADSLEASTLTAASFYRQMAAPSPPNPNPPRDEVPAGRTEADNITVKTWGEIPAFTLAPSPPWKMARSLASSDSNPPPKPPR